MANALGPWPAELNGHPRTIGTFSRCAKCTTEWTWAKYGDDYFCEYCVSGRVPPKRTDIIVRQIFEFGAALDGLRRLAAARGDVKRKAGVSTNKIDQNSDDYDIDFLAIRAHYAVCSIVGATFDDSVSIQGGTPYTVPSQHGLIQVKSSLHRSGHLMFNSKDDIVGDIISLIVPAIDSDSVEIVGWIKRDDFMSRASWRDFGYGKRLAIESAWLSPTPTWIAT